MGVEWLFYNMFALRGGYQNIGQQDSEVGLTLGAGVAYALKDFKLFFDYAWADYHRLDKTQRLSLGVMF
jgi:opacity protein-like surface antigen